MNAVVVRHGPTEWSSRGRHTGRTDISLDDDGRRAAAALAPVFARREFALVITSPLTRARDTASLAGFPDATIDDDLLEWDYGQYEGRTTPDIRHERPGWSLWSDGVLGGETAEDVAARADRVIARARAAGGDCVVFAHGHLLRVLGARWIAAPPTFGQHLLLSTAAVCVLGYERETAALARWNDTSHLAGLASC
jgi:broad specificity phosphatase PhoE